MKEKVENWWVEVIAYCIVFDMILLLGFGL